MRVILVEGGGIASYKSRARSVAMGSMAYAYACS